MEGVAFTDFSGSLLYKHTATRKKKENISTPCGISFLLALSAANFSGMFEKSKNPRIRVWISADERKIPPPDPGKGGGGKYYF
jgi:hypothetical protein